MNFKHNQKVRFNYKGEEMVGTYLKETPSFGRPFSLLTENKDLINPALVTNLRPALKSFDDPQVGDVYVSRDRQKLYVLGSAGRVIFTSLVNMPNRASHSYTKEELTGNGYTILQDEEEEKSERVRVLEEVEGEIKELDLVGILLSNKLGSQTMKEIVLSRIQQLKDKK